MESKSQGGVSLIAQVIFRVLVMPFSAKALTVDTGYTVTPVAARALVGYSQTGVGVTAISDGNYAITANSAGGATLLASNNSPTGADGIIAIANNGIGVVAMGTRAPLLLFATMMAGAPTSGAHFKGELPRDVHCHLNVCLVARPAGHRR